VEAVVAKPAEPKEAAVSKTAVPQEATAPKAEVVEAVAATAAKAPETPKLATPKEAAVPKAEVVEAVVAKPAEPKKAADAGPKEAATPKAEPKKASNPWLSPPVKSVTITDQKSNAEVAKVTSDETRVIHPKSKASLKTKSTAPEVQEAAVAAVVAPLAPPPPLPTFVEPVAFQNSDSFPPPPPLPTFVEPREATGLRAVSAKPVVVTQTEQTAVTRQVLPLRIFGRDVDPGVVRSLRAQSLRHELPQVPSKPNKELSVLSMTLVPHTARPTIAEDNEPLMMTMVPRTSRPFEEMSLEEVKPQPGVLASIWSFFFGSAPSPKVEAKPIVLSVTQVKVHKQDVEHTADAAAEDAMADVDIHDPWSQQEQEDDAMVDYVKREDRELRMDAETVREKPSTPSLNAVRNDAGSTHISGFWDKLVQEDEGITQALKTDGDDVTEYARLVDLQDAKVEASVAEISGPAGERLQLDARNENVGRALEDTLRESS